MPTVFDAHVHLYPSYDLAHAVLSAAKNLSAHLPGGNGSKAVILTERAGQNVFRELQAKQRIGSFAIEPSTTWIKVKDVELLIFPGRQIVTREKLEVHALFTTAQIADGLSLENTMDGVIASGALAALPWSPGKWLFKRGEILKEYLTHSSHPIVLSDPKIRPLGWNPALFSKFNRCIYGTDPLSWSAEASLIGTYATYSDHDIAAPESLRELIQHATLTSVGRRFSWGSAALRTLRTKL